MMRKNYFFGKACVLTMMGLSTLATTVYANPHVSSVTEVQQQTMRISGVIKDSNGESLPGVNVLVKGTTIGAITDADGKFQLNAPTGSLLVVTYVGYASQTVKAKSSLEIILTEDSELLSEVVITGVARGTSKAKLSFTVEKIGDAALKEVTGTTVASTLSGKMPGIKILATSGNPMDEPIIQLRGATSFASTDQPLIIVDGIVTSGVLKDINMEDVENIEVIKGAAAASFYGAKAAGGVIQIITKRGSGLENGKVNVTFKSEVGANWIGFTPERTTAHGHTLDANGYPTRIMEEDQIWDNKYKMTSDPYEDFFTPRVFTSNTLSVGGRSKSGEVNYYASVQHTKNPGVIKMLNGVGRTSFRTNLDAKLSDKITLSTSNLYVRTINDRRSVNFDDIYYADPNANFLAKNQDGTDYIVSANIVSTRNNINPLYDITNKRQEGTANRFLGNYALRYVPAEWLSMNANYSIDFFHYNDFDLTPKGRLQPTSPDGSIRDEGYVYAGSGNTFKHNAEISALLTKSFGNFNTSLRLQYLYEDTKNEGLWGSGSKLAVAGMDIISLEQADPETRDHSSWGSRIVSNSYTAVFNGDYKDTYMFDALVRRDGASVIGDDNIWQTYYRISGAWNIAKSFKIPHVELLKPRISYGTAGILPAYGAKYETFSLSNGVLSGGSQLGNKKLKPALSQEIEAGLDMRFLNRFDLGLTFSRKRNTDLPYIMTVSGVTGFQYQNVNIGEFFTNSYEIMLKANILKKKDFMWDVTVTWDKLDQSVGELGRPDFKVGYLNVASNKPYGKMYSSKFATSLDQVKTSKLIKPGQSVEDVFTINNYGYVVRKDLIGTRDEAHMSILDAQGNTDNEQYIGNMNPDFNMNLMNTLTWKNFMLYFTLSYQEGGLLYNNTKVYMAFAGRNAKFWDMSKRPWANRKPMGYSNQFSRGSGFIEDATFLKLREIALNYSFTKSQLSKIGLNFVNGVKVGVIGRNLFTLTKYSGPDPETRTVESGVLNGSDTPKYPSDIRTLTGTISVEF